MGYQGVEFYAPYFEWTESQTKQMRKLLDDLGIRCFSTHNDSSYLDKEKIGRTRENEPDSRQQYVADASSDVKPGLDGLESRGGFAEFSRVQPNPSGLKSPGYHNHQREFTPVENQRLSNSLPILSPPSCSSWMWETCLEAVRTRWRGFAEPRANPLASS